MFTRTCPITGCEDLPCARFETANESRWDLDKIEWEKDARLADESAKALSEKLDNRLSDISTKIGLSQ